MTSSDYANLNLYKSKWLKKIDYLFTDINITIDNRYDSRVNQIKNIYIALVDIVEELNNTIKYEQAISKESLSQLLEFREKLKLEIPKSP